MRALLIAIVVQNFALFSFGANADGFSVRIHSERWNLRGVQTFRENPFEAYNGSIGITHVDYFFSAGATEIFLREGDAVLTDPDTPDTPVEMLFDETFGEFKVAGVICRSDGWFVGGILISGKVEENSATVVGSRVYLSVRSRERKDLAREIREFASTARVRVAGMTEFRLISETAMAKAVERLLGYLERSDGAN